MLVVALVVHENLLSQKESSNMSFSLIKVASLDLFSRVYQGRSERRLQN